MNGHALSGPRSILVITSGSLCCNPRPLKEVLTLWAAGYTVTVLNVFESEERLLTDAELLSHTTVQRITVGQNERPWQRFLRRAQLWTARRAVRYLSWESVHTLGVAKELYVQAKSRRAELTIVHNEAPFWVGRRLLQQGRAVAADFEDWHSEDLLPEARRHRPIRLLRSLERDLLRLASYTTTTSTALADSLHRTYGGKKPFVVTNSFPLQTLPSVRALNEPPSFFWFSQTVGPGRGLEQFIRAWSATRHPSRLVLLGAVSNGFPERLRALMPADRRSHVEFMDPVSPQKLPAVIASHDVGLALELPSPPSRDLTITNKILQYLNAGLAVVASDTVGQREVLTRGPGAGILVNLEDGPRFTAALDNLLAAPAQLTAMREAARKLAEDFYCWESESRAFKQIVADSMSTIQR